MEIILKNKWTKIVIGSLSSLLILILLVGNFTPWLGMGIAKVFFAKREHKAGETVQVITKTLDNGINFIKDLTYGATYENSFLDIYLPDNKVETPKPAIFIVHGGGYLADDKKLTSETAEKLSSEGYVVININYALVPAVHYPEPIYQLGEAYEFIQKNSIKYGIDMNNISFCGDSAGGQLIGQFVNIQVNKQYSDEIGIPAVVKENSIKAVLFYSSLLQPDNIHSGKVFGDFLFKQCVWGYFNVTNWENSKEAKEASIVGNVNDKFPPTFITDGNTMTFTNQAQDLAEELTQLGVPNELNLYPKEEAELIHEYQFNYSLEQSVDNYRKATAFLEKHLKQ